MMRLAARPMATNAPIHGGTAGGEAGLALRTLSLQQTDQKHEPDGVA